ncbi:MAG: nitrous oxide reductase family maturation protein NosD [Phycisphaeraceae bacterium]|nr:MAG: nitrous oxide reductase family maturation protein NosD [Phycisphaeraceae bacterium]
MNSSSRRHTDGKRTKASPRRVPLAMARALFAVAALLLIVSFFQPYWKMTLQAPQYPQGLTVQAYLHGLTGDVDEIDGLNHYIGMRPLEEAAQLERQFSPVMIGVMSAMLLAAMFVPRVWATLLALPVVFFPPGFLLDLFFWLHHFGQNLDPTAALSSSVKPFTPPVLGVGKVGNFRTVAGADTGLYMAAAASLLVIAGIALRWRAHGKSAQSAAAAPAAGRLGASAVAACAAVIVFSVSARTGADGAAPRFDIHEAIRAADEGATIVAPSGVYDAPIILDRSVRLIAERGAVIDACGRGNGVRITAPGAELHGFTIRNTGASLHEENTGVLVLAPRAVIENNTIENALFGISLKNASGSIVRGNTIVGMDLHVARRGDGIRAWHSNDLIIEGNTVRAVRDVVVWYSERVALTDNHIVDSRYGLHFMYCHDNVLTGNRLEGNSVGAFLMYSRNIMARRNTILNNRGPSGYGIGLKDMQGVTIEENAIVGNRVGIYFDNPPMFEAAHDEFRANLIAYNDVGVLLQPLVSQVAIFENSFIENIQQVGIRGGGELRGNELTRDGRGNYWSDYRGFDLDGDGVGDHPHRVEGLWDSLVDREPALRLFLYSPAQQAVEFAASAFPVVRPRPIVSDGAPLMRPAHTSPTPEDESDPRCFALLAGALLTIVAITLVGAMTSFGPTRRAGRPTKSHTLKAEASR